MSGANGRPRAHPADAADVLPQNLEAEESLLGCVLQSGSAIDAIRHAIRREHFFKRDTHGEIYDAAVAVHDSRQEVEPLLVISELERRGRLDAVGGRIRLHELARLTPRSANVAHYANLIREQAKARQQLAAFTAAREEISTGGLDAATRRSVLDALAEDEPNAGAADWLDRASDLLTEPDPGETPFAVDELLVDGAIAMIVGPPKLGKTWLVLELALALTTGREALGSYVVPNRGPVVAVLEESSRTALHRRLDQLVRGYALDPAAVADFHFAASQRVRLNEPVWQQRLLDTARAIRPRAIFLDPLARLKGADVDENVQREMAPILDFLGELRAVAGSAVVWVHHTGHNGSHGRGSSDLESFWESKLTLKEKDGAVSLKAEHREAGHSEEIRYRLAFDHTSRSLRILAVDGEPSPSEVGRERREEQARELLRDDPTLSSTAVFRAIGGNKQSALDLIKRIRDELEVERFRTLGNRPEPGSSAPVSASGSTDPLLEGSGTAAGGLVPDERNRGEGG